MDRPQEGPSGRSALALPTRKAQLKRCPSNRWSQLLGCGCGSEAAQEENRSLVSVLLKRAGTPETLHGPLPLKVKHGGNGLSLTTWATEKGMAKHAEGRWSIHCLHYLPVAATDSAKDQLTEEQIAEFKEARTCPTSGHSRYKVEDAGRFDEPSQHDAVR